MKISNLIGFACLFLVFSFVLSTQRNPNHLTIEFLDVGHGDAIYITTPNGKRILIDGGESFDIDFEMSKLIPFYFCSIDVVVLTHPHLDHLGGLNRIMDRCKISTVMFNDVDYSSKAFSEFKEKSEKIITKNLYKGDGFEFDGVTFKVLWPSKELLQSSISDINDVSIVLLVDFGEFEGLFLADAGRDVLENLDLKGVLSLVDGEFDVIKVSHHGSKYALYEPLYVDLKAKNCIIQVGKDNKFGHPDKEVLDFLETVNCTILRNDERGNIILNVL